MAVEVASGAVVVLGGSWVGMAGEDLGIAEGDPRVEREWAPGSAGCLFDVRLSPDLLRDSDDEVARGHGFRWS